MGKLFGIMLVIGLMACPAWAWQDHFSAEVSVTETNTNTAISGMPGPGSNRAHTVLIVNDGPDDIFFDLTTGVATASGAGVKSGESIEVTNDDSGRFYITNVGLISDSGDTASVRIFAFPSK